MFAITSENEVKLILVLITIVIITNWKVAARQARIVGGIEVDPASNEAPWIVQMLLCNAASKCGLCGSTFIAPEILLTAAHCANKDETVDIRIYVNKYRNLLSYCLVVEPLFVILVFHYLFLG